MQRTGIEVFYIILMTIIIILETICDLRSLHKLLHKGCLPYVTA